MIHIWAHLLRNALLFGFVLRPCLSAASSPGSWAGCRPVWGGPAPQLLPLRFGLAFSSISQHHQNMNSLTGDRSRGMALDAFHGSAGLAADHEHVSASHIYTPRAKKFPYRALCLKNAQLLFCWKTDVESVSVGDTTSFLRSGNVD